MEIQDWVTKIEALNDEQRKRLWEEMLSLRVDDSEEENRITQLKHTAYALYARDIADLVAEVEVHFHDLPEFIYGQVETIFRMSAVAINEETESGAESDYQEIIKYETFVIQYIQVRLIDCYLQEIKHYRKTLTKFNCNGVLMENGMPAMKEISSRLKQIRKAYQSCKSSFHKSYTRRQVKGVYTVTVKTDKLTDNMVKNLQNCSVQAKDCLELCEKYYPQIIANGYICSWQKRCVHVLWNIFSFGLAAVGLWILFK